MAGGKLRFSPCLFRRENMKRKIVALIEVDNDTAFQKIDDDLICYIVTNGVAGAKSDFFRKCFYCR